MVASRTSAQGGVNGNLTSPISGNPIRCGSDVSSYRDYIYPELMYAGNG
jgi:hypothetical protein